MKLLFENGINYIKNSRIYSRVKYRMKNLIYRKRFLYQFMHPYRSLKIKSGYSPRPNYQFDDSLLIKKLKEFYLLCNDNFDARNNDSMWTEFFQRLHGEIHSAFIRGNHKKIVDILRNPGKYNLFYGFDNLNKDSIDKKWLGYRLEPEIAMDCLLSLCEAVGIVSMSNPERLFSVQTINPEEAVQLLSLTFKFNLSFPNPFKGEFGIQTKLGIISYRTIQSIYQAWRISEIVKNIPEPKILEIGGGLGRTAYYCRHFGIYDYTIVDIPISTLAQGNFLGRVLHEKDLIMVSESADLENHNSKIKLTYPKAFFNSTRKYDLIINADSMTELDKTIAKDYLRKIRHDSSLFLSINHENNSFSVNSIWKETTGLNRLHRIPNWVRRGYVEELFEKCPVEPELNEEKKSKKILQNQETGNKFDLAKEKKLQSEKIAVHL
jgi:hypothetical protein